MLVIPALSLVLLLIPPDDPPRPDAGSGQETVLVTRRHSFRVPIDLDAATRQRAREIVLFMSEDRGQTWSEAAHAQPGEPGIPFTAGHDGAFWFALQSVDEDGTRHPGAQAELRVAYQVRVGEAGDELMPWGRDCDPAGDCVFLKDPRVLTIAVAAGRHDLSAEVGDLTAPRVVREVRGDFIAQVKVRGNVQHEGERQSEHFLAYHGGGLLLWQDPRTYVRLERAAVVRDGQTLHYVNFELRRDGRHAATQSRLIPDEPCFLRLERRGGHLLAAASRDGLSWGGLNPLLVELPESLQLGVAAINTSSEPFTALFSDMAVSAGAYKTPESAPPPGAVTPSDESYLDPNRSAWNGGTGSGPRLLARRR